MIDPARLGPLLRELRDREGWSLRRAADETGVSFATIARVEGGNLPDLETYLKLSAYLGLAGGDAVEMVERPQTTLDAITLHLEQDPALRPDDAERISRIVRDMYDALARPTSARAVHLRSSSTFKPLAARMIGELLDDMRGALEADGAS